MTNAALVDETIEFLRWLSSGGMGWLTAPDKAGPLADKLEATDIAAELRAAQQLAEACKASGDEAIQAALAAYLKLKPTGGLRR